MPCVHRLHRDEVSALSALMCLCPSRKSTALDARTQKRNSEGVYRLVFHLHFLFVSPVIRFAGMTYAVHC